jgi:hypothetical protein
MRDEGSHSPGCRHPQPNHERYADETPGSGIVAPALEHGNCSNDEEYDRDCAKYLNPHLFPPPIMLMGSGDLGKD